MRFFIFAGENSGDLHGSHLIRALKSKFPSINLVGVGGPAMRAEGLHCLLNTEEFQVMGFSDVLKALPKLCKHFYTICQAILNLNPEGVILIDYPGFNLRLAKRLRKKGYRGKIIQYICPTIWAHGKQRIRTMAESLDLLLTILPFEPKYFLETSLKVAYVGHPLVNIIDSSVYHPNWTERVGIPKEQPLIAIFPGSRIGEIQRNLPLQLEAARLLKNKYPEVCFGLSYTHEELLPLMHRVITETQLGDVYLVPKALNYDLMHHCHTALAKSGTVTLELALHQRPSLITYKLTKLNYWMAKYILKLRLPHYCLVNILAEKEVFPELIDQYISAHQLFQKLESLYKEKNTRDFIHQECLHVRQKLGKMNAHIAAVEAIGELFTC